MDAALRVSDILGQASVAARVPLSVTGFVRLQVLPCYPNKILP